MTDSLFVAWQYKRSNPDGRSGTRRWYPIGRLDTDGPERQYTFCYTQGALKAKQEAGFEPLEAFPDLEKVYRSKELFSVFRNRLPNPSRKDYSETVKRLGLTEKRSEPFEVLALTGGARQTDNLEVFPKIKKGARGAFRSRFFLHGWRHVNDHSQSRVAKLIQGEPLQVTLEFNNPAAPAAVQLQTPSEYYVIGWAPRYLVSDMLKAMSEAPSDLKACVVRFNPPPAPYNQRVMVEISGRFPDSFEPMATEDYRLLVEKVNFE
ncbi:DNA-binding protein [Salinisphaera sp. T5B8]|uniref:DNA-binding protein n=1 Tax=Salinisphaera sp. T5B8 TaxID=1304154 RepID=UPI00333E4BCE